MNRRTSGIDDRGAILTFGIFLAPFLVAAVYYLVACANVMMQREGLQAAADASAFAPAVVSARGMNVIAVINVLMMCVMSVVIPVRAMLPAYIEVASWGCNPWNPCQCARVADAKRAAAQLTPIAMQVENRASDLLDALSDAQNAIAERIPPAAVFAAQQSTRRTTAFLASNRMPEVYAHSVSERTLPVEDDEWRQVCARTRPFVQEIALRLAAQTLSTMGTCQSGPWALGVAQPNLLTPDNPLMCRSGPAPKKVRSEASNGSDHMQFWSRVQGREFDGPRTGVEVGAKTRSARKGNEAPRHLDVGFAEAEFYYDCSGSWSSSGCNRNENAMWNTRWTARLRRVHAPTDVSFDGDDVVKNELASADYWAGVRADWLAERRDFTTGRPAETNAAQTLMEGREGPLQ